MFHEVPGVIKVLAAGGAGDHFRHGAVVQPGLGVTLTLASEPQLAVVALVCDQTGDRVKTHPGETGILFDKLSVNILCTHLQLPQIKMSGAL